MPRRPERPRVCDPAAKRRWRTAEEQQSSAPEQPKEGQTAQVETTAEAELLSDTVNLLEGATSSADIQGYNPTAKRPRTRRRAKASSLAEASSVAPIEAASEGTADRRCRKGWSAATRPRQKQNAGEGDASSAKRRASRASARGENAKAFGLATDSSAPQAVEAGSPQPPRPTEQGAAADRAVAEGPLSTGLGLAKALGDEMADFSHRLLAEGALRAKEIVSARTLADLVSIQARHLRVESGAWLRHTSRLSEIYMASLRGLGRE